jgi:hypothetical protein
MTSPSHDGPALLRPKSLDESSVKEEDDDVLIEKLRARACDPGRRFDTADVPALWISERYGSARLEQRRDVIRGYCSDGTVQLKSDVEEVAVYYADAPRGPLFPPLSMADLEKAEHRIGRRLPELLRRVYTEVANGGFGPDSGLASLTDGNRAPGDVSDCQARSASMSETVRVECRRRGCTSLTAAARWSGTSPLPRSATPCCSTTRTVGFPAGAMTRTTG